MVTPEAPVKVVKKAHSSTAITARPPRNQLNQAWNRAMRRSPALLSERTKPATVNSGSAGTSGCDSMAYASSGTTSRAPPEPRNCSRVKPLRITKMGVPMNAEATRTSTRGRRAAAATATTASTRA